MNVFRIKSIASWRRDIGDTALKRFFMVRQRYLRLRQYGVRLAGRVFGSAGRRILSRRGASVPFRGLVVALLAAFSCLHVMSNLSPLIWERFAVWRTVGIVIYLMYGYSHSKLE